MNFVSPEYFVLLGVTVVFFAFCHSRFTAWIILLTSFTFYAWGNPKYLLFLVTVILLAYIGGLVLEKVRSLTVLWLFILGNLSFLFYFKYFSVTVEYLNFLGRLLNLPALPEVKTYLPIGVSFFTFQAIGYLIDVYRGTIAPEKSPLQFATFISFFPQLVAGPIERASHLLPQLKNAGAEWGRRVQLDRGLFLLLKGVFLKFAIADNLSVFVDEVYANPAAQTPTNAVVAVYFFAIQIYCDFYGYTCIALGSANLLGVDIINNFEHPYLRQNIQEFWRRWHISLSQWFRDYVYISLGGNRVTPLRHKMNLLATMALTAVWHGASLPFLLWGFLHGSALVIHRIWTLYIERLQKNHSSFAAAYRLLSAPVGWFITLHFIVLAWIPFRAPDMATVMVMAGKLGEFLMSIPHVEFNSYFKVFYLLILYLFIVFETLDYFLCFEKLFVHFHPAAQTVCLLILLLLIQLGPIKNVTFIYFQF